jgi:hypothetical protein
MLLHRTNAATALGLRLMHCKLPYLCLTNKHGTESDPIETRHNRTDVYRCHTVHTQYPTTQIDPIGWVSVSLGSGEPSVNV